MPIRCPHCRTSDGGSIPALLPGSLAHPGPPWALQLRGGLLAPIRPPITHRELASAARALARTLDCLRADLVSIRRPNTYIT
eukprot:9364602-Pyramimonas_sp.AAC.1